MKIRVTGHSGEFTFPFHTSNSWQAFANQITEMGHSLCGSDPSEKADLLICNSHNRDTLEAIAYWELPQSKRILVIWEPEIVDHEIYKKENISLYGRVFAPSREWAKWANAKFFNWPQAKISLELENQTKWAERESKTVMIQGNKFSARKGEMYSLRRCVLKKTSQEKLCLYGTNWNHNFKFDWSHWFASLRNTPIQAISLKSIAWIGMKWPNYKGPTNDKIKTMSQYRISVVIENSDDFVSEKLFDSISAGCVTIYVGTNLKMYSLPEDVCIQVPARAKEITNKIEELLQLSPDALYEIATKQRIAIESVIDEWIGNTVLSNLAKEILK